MYNGPGQAYIGKDADLNSYDKVSIDTFGKNLLGKLGWKEGEALGKDDAKRKSNANIV
jgi:G-patch domain